MKRLIILGNGFDLAHGLKTSYSDFILDLYKNELLDFFENCDVDHWKERATYSNGPIKILQSSLVFISEEHKASVKRIATFKELKEYIKSFNITISPTSSPSILGLTQNHLDTYNWADIEAIYYDNLLDIVERNNKRKLLAAHKQRIIKLNEELDFMKDKLIDYLTRVQEERSISPDTHDFNFWETLLKRTDSDTPKEAFILNFNYTNTILHYSSPDQAIEFRDRPVQINNIHGHLENPDSIIFGYGDEVDSFYKQMEDLNDNEVLRHAKSFGYFKSSNYRKLLTFIDSGEYEVWVIGHSCGLSDRVMLKKIFEHSLCKRIKILHYSWSDSNDYIEKTQQISRHFSDKELMRERIVPFNPGNDISVLIPSKKDIIMTG